MAHALGREASSADQLRVHLPKNSNGPETKAPLVKPGTATPTAFGARWGEVYGSFSIQPVSRYATVSKYNRHGGKWSDGTLSLRMGIGNPHWWVGLDATLNIFDALPESLGASDGFGTVRTFSLKLHQALPHESAVALEYENVWYNSPEAEDQKQHLWGSHKGVYDSRATHVSLQPGHSEHRTGGRPVPTRIQASAPGEWDQCLRKCGRANLVIP